MNNWDSILPGPKALPFLHQHLHKLWLSVKNFPFLHQPRPRHLYERMALHESLWSLELGVHTCIGMHTRSVLFLVRWIASRSGFPWFHKGWEGDGRIGWYCPIGLTAVWIWRAGAQGSVPYPEELTRRVSDRLTWCKECWIEQILKGFAFCIFCFVLFLHSHEETEAGYLSFSVFLSLS